ncbi:MAG TPA: Ig-like domain-containing protein, partial [Roseiflexaceae bacterium]|nr:Ig-like domain-containing protein [Roseiflexaceae bacterium]
APVQGTPLTGVYAFDRARMLNGQAATYQKFQVQRNFMLPSNLDGPTPPPAGTPNLFYTIMDDTYWPSVGFPGVDRLEIWEYHVDWATPANSTFAKTQELPTSFNYLMCGFFVFNCVPQQGTAQKVDALAEYPMWRFVYRNFGIHQSLVGNFTVKVTEPDRTGIRWFELRKTSGGWSIAQQGTQAPDSHYRWMGSAAMDRSGNLALGYSVSSSSLNPAIRYATRAYTETLGTLQNEASLQESAGVQTGSNRWGDYSAMTVDPVDDCTFWFTSEYYAATSSRSWSTRIGAFKLPSCGISQLAVVNTPDDAAPLPGQQVTLTITISNTSLIDAANAALELVLPAGLAPAGPATLVPPAAGTLGALPGIVSNLNVPAGQAVTLSLPVKVSTGLAPATKLISAATLSGTNLAAGAATSTITVGDAAPIAADDSATTPRGVPVRIPVLANDVDLNGRSLSIDAVDLPGHGTAVISGTEIVYTPAPGFGGSDQFTYVVTDGTLFGVATVYVDVTPKDHRVYLPLVRR